MANYLSENMAYLRRLKNLSQQEVADLLQIKRSRLSAYELGRAEPGVEMLLKYAEHFEIEPGRLLTSRLTEEGFMPGDIGDTRPLRVLAITLNQDNEENIELVQEKAAAGYLSSYSDPEYVRNLPRFRIPFLKGGTFRAFEIRGDSMLPIPSGAIVIGQYVEKPRDVKAGDTYIFVTENNGILFKRVASVDKKSIVLKSDNRFYASYSLPLSDIREIWKSKLYMSSDFSPDIN
jgi:transcriptional regulator with XRE-family HTH domain